MIVAITCAQSDLLMCLIRPTTDGLTGNRKYQVNNKTDKYILNILEHSNLQNTMLTLLQICIQEQHDINLFFLPHLDNATNMCHLVCHEYRHVWVDVI
jgi:hypothetical protein